ncbi:MAG: hypothetical protein E7413_01585 [Ruminococcaceae bacterium]|nr:hypothetical protein [Oscillospiraceae bacterium]
MLCNQCGKNNPFGVKECTYCGAFMPAQEACGGFADILTYQPPQGQQPAQTAQQPAQFSQQAPAATYSASGYRAEYGRENPFRRQLVKQRKISNILLIISLVLVVVTCFCVINFGKTKEKLSDTETKLSTQEKINRQLQEQLNQPAQQAKEGQIPPNVETAKRKAVEDSKQIAKKALELLTGNSAGTGNGELMNRVPAAASPASTSAATPTPTPGVNPEPSLTATPTPASGENSNSAVARNSATSEEKFANNDKQKPTETNTDVAVDSAQ